MNELTVTEYKNVRVLTTQQIAEAYEADVKVISNNFNRNKERYIEGKHFICLEGEELKIFKTNHHFDESSRINKLYLWTEKGAFLHAKSLNTDKAWEVYDRLVDEYFDKGSRKPLTVAEQIQLLAQGTADHEERIEKLENTMTIDYGQQKYLGDLVSIVVIEVLGGKNSNAYSEIGKKVFAECNRDVKSYFGVNARNNIPKLRYEEAVKYIKGWQPCTNTKCRFAIAIMILIQKENEVKTVKDIKSYEFYGDNPEIFHSLVGFEIADILFTHTKEENENVVVVKCANKQHVEIDLLFKEDGILVTEPFAVYEDLTIIE